MRNLHKIHHPYTDKQLSHIWFILQDGNYDVRINEGVIEKLYKSNSSQWVITETSQWNDGWWDDINSQYIMRQWLMAGKPMPNLSKLK